jgi:DnaJ-class molecular chaperone
MSDRGQDLQQHYTALRLCPGAGLKEVDEAYQALEAEWRRDQNVPRFQIQHAYRFLSDPEKKAAYDAQLGPKAEPSSKNRRLILGGMLMFLFVFAGLIFPGFLLGVPQSFQAGDNLVHSGGKGILGAVLRFEQSHHFPNAVIGEAYLIESPAGERRWYPAGDLERYYQRQPAETVTSVMAADGLLQSTSD